MSHQPSPDATLVILTGAGISAESGLRTFRAEDGLWEEHRIEDVATPEGFRRDPDLVHRFYNERRRRLAEAQPNPAHEALARLEATWPGEVLLVTQNVDDLHERAGTRNLVHLHGELLKARCEACRNVVPWPGDLDLTTVCPGCGCSGRMRPHIVWFGEMPLELDRVGEALARCALFAAAGTSGHVYPAAGFVELVEIKTHTVELNLQPSAISHAFREQHLGFATETVPRWVEGLLQGIGRS